MRTSSNGSWSAASRVPLAGACAALALLLGAGCSGNDGPSPPVYLPVSASSEGKYYTLETGDVRMVVDASLGARITEFSFRGDNVLTGPEVNIVSYGSTYWPSPQSTWCTAGGNCWPPPSAIDNDPWTGAIDAGTNVVTLTSATASIFGFVDSQVTVTKRLTPLPDIGAIDVTYTLTNISPSVPVSVAPWQVSRVAGTGSVTFFPVESGTISYGAGSDPAFAVTEANGIGWYGYALPSANSKALADGSGWIGHVTKEKLLYLLSSSTDVQASEAAPGEAEVELFAGTGAGDFMEVELQGPYTTIPPGGTLEWSVQWRLRPLPSGTVVAPGNGALVQFAADELAP